MRRASILKKKVIDDIDYQEGRDLSMTVIEQNFTNFNRCLFMIKVENIRQHISNINVDHKDVQLVEKKSWNGERGNPEKSFISAAGSKQKLKISNTRLKEGLSNFMFDLYPEDQRFQSSLFIKSNLQSSETCGRYNQTRILIY